MSKQAPRTFSRAFKLGAIARMDAGENVSALSRELGVKREKLYHWRSRYRAGGAEAFRQRRGRPTKAEAATMAATRVPARAGSDLEQARRRVAELERKVGQQQLDLEFFREALRHVEALRRANGLPGVTASSPASRR
jgi:transposase-like protein